MILSGGDSGFTLAELVIALVIVTALTGMVIVSSTGWLEKRKTDDTRTQLRQFEQIFEENYTGMVKKALATGTGWTYYDGRCINPRVASLTTVEMDFYAGYYESATNQGVGLAQRMLENGCTQNSVSADTKFAVYSCVDKFGTPLNFTVANPRTRRTLAAGNLSGYFDLTVPVSYTIRSAGLNKNMNDADDIVYTFTTAKLDNYYMEKSKENVRTLATALKNFAKRRLNEEANLLSASTSLSSYDDNRVPWVWQVYAGDDASAAADDARANQQCVIDTSVCRATNTCSCGYAVAAPWNWRPSTSAASNSRIRMAKHLGLVPSGTSKDAYIVLYDASYQYLYIDLLSLCGATSAAGGAGITAVCGAVPPAPGDNYTWAVNPPFTSKICTTWGYCETFTTP